MDKIEQLAQAALARDHIKLRSLVQDLMRANIDFSRVPRPSTQETRLLAITASLVELLALRQKQMPPRVDTRSRATEGSILYAQISGRHETFANFV